jgi:hypothetical protein
MATPSPTPRKRTGGPRTPDGKDVSRFNNADVGAWSAAFTEVRRYLRSVKRILREIE